MVPRFPILSALATGNNEGKEGAGKRALTRLESSHLSACDRVTVVAAVTRSSTDHQLSIGTEVRSDRTWARTNAPEWARAARARTNRTRTRTAGSTSPPLTRTRAPAALHLSALDLATFHLSALDLTAFDLPALGLASERSATGHRQRSDAQRRGEDQPQHDVFLHNCDSFRDMSSIYGRGRRCARQVPVGQE